MENTNVKISKVIHRAESRGRSRLGWLDSRHNFSFAGYFDPDRIRFGALRVLNDDIVQPGAGFGKHPHDNMEIISIPLSGSLAHKDSMGHEQKIRVDEVQVMSAGTGIFHSEYNGSSAEPVNFLQIWIFPDQKNVIPVYDQKSFRKDEALNDWQILVENVEGNDPNSLKIHQEATLSRVFLEAGQSLDYNLDSNSFGSFLFVIQGEVEVDNDRFLDRDAVGLTGINSFTIQAHRDSYLLNIEVPDVE